MRASRASLTRPQSRSPFSAFVWLFVRTWINKNTDGFAVYTTQAIRSRKTVIRSNGSGYPLEKIVIRSKQLSAALLLLNHFYPSRLQTEKQSVFLRIQVSLRTVDVSPRSLPLREVSRGERARLSDRNSILMTQNLSGIRSEALIGRRSSFIVLAIV